MEDRRAGQISSLLRADDKVVPFVTPDRTYVAFEIKENPRRLHIRTALQGSFYPSYHHLADIRFDHDHETYFTLILQLHGSEGERSESRPRGTRHRL